jgi:hypothetical protein
MLPSCRGHFVGFLPTLQAISRVRQSQKGNVTARHGSEFHWLVLVNPSEFPVIGAVDQPFEPVYFSLRSNKSGMFQPNFPAIQEATCEGISMVGNMSSVFSTYFSTR